MLFISPMLAKIFIESNIANMAELVEFPQDPESFKLVESFWCFDRAFYEELGANFSQLEDPRPEAPMHRLRRAAAVCLYAQESNANDRQLLRARINLRDVRDQVLDIGRSSLSPALEALSEVTSYEHPALKFYAERNPEDFQRLFKSRILGENLIDDSRVGKFVRSYGRMVQIDLAAPVDSPDSDSGRYAQITPPNCGGSTSAYAAYLTAGQLIYARAAATYDI